MKASFEGRTGVLAVDCGGTKISGAIIDPTFEILKYEIAPSRENVDGIADPQLLITKTLISTLLRYADENGISLVGAAAGFPEYVNLSGMLTTRENIDWPEQPKDDFSRLTGFAWVIESDVRCAGLAEARFGAGKEFQDFVYITISSGISHTHFVDGIAITGDDGDAIGFGVMDIKVSDKIFTLENYTSGLGIARRYGQISGDYSLNAKDIFARFESDPIAREIIESAAQVLGTEIAEFAHSLPTDSIVIGGGLWLGSQKYQSLVSSAFKIACQSIGISPRILNAEVEHSGVIGAAIYALSKSF